MIFAVAKQDSAALADGLLRFAGTESNPEDYPALLADLEAKKVVLLRADWTRRDPAITAALASLGRSGVPVYVFYRPGKPPVVLTEVLSVDEVRATIAQL